jgi:hypothetical protein
VPATGGQPSPATEPDKSRNELSHLFPHFLPDGRHFFYLAINSDGQNPAAWVGTLDSKERHPLTGITSQVKYSSSGHAVFIRDGALMAQAFDVDRLELTGEAFPLADPFVSSGVLQAPFSVSKNGGLVYRAGETRVNSRLTWFDRTGRQTGIAGAVGDYAIPVLSPDAHHVAFNRGIPSDIWILDIARGLTSRFTMSPGSEGGAAWSPDGKTIAFDSGRPNRRLYERAVDAIGEDKPILKNETETALGSSMTLSDWSRDGRYLAFTQNVRDFGLDVFALPLSGDRQPLRITQTPFSEQDPRISPDSRWIAYASNESGSRNEIYIQSFPEPAVKKQMSTAGGVAPRWRRDGKELYYLAPDFTLMAVSIASSGSALQVGAPAPLFQIRNSESGYPRNYDVSADGRFLVNVSTDELSATPITVILNWAANRQR